MYNVFCSSGREQSRRGLEDYKFIAESLHYKLKVWSLKKWLFTGQGRSNEKILSSCIVGNVVSSVLGV